jgi:hypothetical protein
MMQVTPAGRQSQINLEVVMGRVEERKEGYIAYNQIYLN